jgi:hypothetical protein
MWPLISSRELPASPLQRPACTSSLETSIRPDIQRALACDELHLSNIDIPAVFPQLRQ